MALVFSVWGFTPRIGGEHTRELKKWRMTEGMLCFGASRFRMHAVDRMEGTETAVSGGSLGYDDNMTV